MDKISSLYKSKLGCTKFILLGVSVFEVLNKLLESTMHEMKAPFLAALTEDLHVLPDFHGNRYLVTVSIATFN